MKHLKNKVKNLSLIAIALLAGVYMWPSAASAAGTANYTMSSSTTSYTVGNTVVVSLYEDSGTDAVTTTEAQFTYPASLLTYQSATSPANWDISLGTSGGGGTVTIDRAHCQQDPNTGQCTNPISGKALVATVYFTATAAGQATLSYASGTVVYRASDSQPETLTTSGITLTINVPAPPTQPSPPSQPAPPSGGGSTSGGGTASPPKTTSSSSAPKSSTSTSSSSGGSSSTRAPASNSSTAPASTASQAPISNIQVKNLSDTTATITWETAVPATSEVDYGFNSNYGFVSVDSTLTKTHSVVLDPSYLQASKDYHFKIKSVDAAGKLITSQDVSFKTLAAGGKSASSSHNAVWAVLALLLVLAAAGAVGYSLLRHMRHMHLTPAAGASGGTIVVGGPGVVKPEAPKPKSEIVIPVIKPSPPPEDKTPKL